MPISSSLKPLAFIGACIAVSAVLSYLTLASANYKPLLIASMSCATSAQLALLGMYFSHRTPARFALFVIASIFSAYIIADAIHRWT